MKFILILSGLFVLSANASFPLKLKCSDPFQALTLDSNGFNAIELRNGSYEEKLRRWEADVKILDKQILDQIVSCPSCLEEVFSARLTITKLAEGSLGTIPLAKRLTDKSIEVRAICYQDIGDLP